MMPTGRALSFVFLCMTPSLLVRCGAIGSQPAGKKSTTSHPSSRQRQEGSSHQTPFEKQIEEDYALKTQKIYRWCFKACSTLGQNWVCSWTNSCSACNATLVCPILKATCYTENQPSETSYGGLRCINTTCKGCHDCNLKGNEWLTSSVSWFRTGLLSEKQAPINKKRHAWFYDRKEMQPIVGDTTVIAGVLYSFSKSTLKMSVFFPPLYPNESREVYLRVEAVLGDTEARVSSCHIMEDIWHCLFRVDKLSTRIDYRYHISYHPNKEKKNSVLYQYDGIIPRQHGYPKVAALSCFGPDNTKDKHDLVNALLAQSPDLIVLQGDLVYGSSNIFYGILETLYSLRRLTKNRPTIVQMDDHDYAQGNLWGAGQSEVYNSGSGFKLPPCYVNLIQVLALSHNPDSPVRGMTLENGITINYSNYEYGSYMDFAILEVRKFKNKPLKQHNNNSEAVQGVLDSLLGVEQEAWLQEWCSIKNNKIKVVLAQTPFAGLATHFSGKEKGIRAGVTGFDPNGFPLSGRTRAMKILRGCTPLILSGDQHLSIAVYYDDYGIGECASPAAINDIFWRVNRNSVGETHVDGAGNQYTLRNVWQVDDSVSERFFPSDTRSSSVFVKDNRADGFMTVTFDGTFAYCHAHSYRNSSRVKWTTGFPALLPVEA